MGSKPKDGALRAWHIPQIPGAAFHVEVKDVEDAKRILRLLAAYDQFQLDEGIRPDYSSVQGLETADGHGGWEEWNDPGSGEDISEIMRVEE